jgi:enoyl-CoA hydratase/carnithine racemase
VGGVSVVRERAIAKITIDRPEARNALNLAAMADLDAALAEVARWEVHAIFIRGAGDRAFVSGGDLKELESVREEKFALDMARRMRATLDRIPGLPMPVVAIVNGHAIGGGAEVAIACDYRLAAADTRIGFTQATLGLMPAWGGIERLVQAIGRGRALHLLTTGRTIDATEAKAIGLFEEVVARAAFEDRVEELAAELADVPLQALAGIKRAADSALPYARPELAADATADFARAWVAETHWEAMARAQERVQKRRGTR